MVFRCRIIVLCFLLFIPPVLADESRPNSIKIDPQILGTPPHVKLIGDGGCGLVALLALWAAFDSSIAAGASVAALNTVVWASIAGRPHLTAGWTNFLGNRVRKDIQKLPENLLRGAYSSRGGSQLTLADILQTILNTSRSYPNDWRTYLWKNPEWWQIFQSHLSDLQFQVGRISPTTDLVSWKYNPFQNEEQTRQLTEDLAHLGKLCADIKQELNRIVEGR